MFGANQTNQFAGRSKGVAFFRTTGTVETVFVTTTVTFPRSSKPTHMIITCTGPGMVQVQGNGAEFYSGALSANVPLVLPLTGLPESLTLAVQTQILIIGSVTGTVFYT